MSLIPPKAINLSLHVIVYLCLTSSHGNGNLEHHTTLIFHHCSTQKLDDFNATYASGRTRLFQELVSKSRRSKSSAAFVMAGDRSASSLYGLFQCRGDLDNGKCNECIKAIPNISNGLCDDSMAARIQLSGCHVQYEADGYDDFTPDDQLKFKKCGEPQGVVSSEIFEQIRSQAFEALESLVGDHHEDSIGFYSIKHEGIHVMAQCELGIIGGCKCGECVVDAIHIIEDECDHSSISGQVYMDSCFLNYEFNPHELHGVGDDFHREKKGGGGSYGKLAAIAIGGVAVLGMAFLFCRFINKKNDDW